MRLLFVCTANVCRSPSAQAVVDAAAIPGLHAASAGVRATAGLPGCLEAPLLGERAPGHRSRLLTAQDVATADLILIAQRDHGADVVALEPSARARTFTVPQAGRLARWLLDAGILDAAQSPQEFPPDDHRAAVAPLPPMGQRTPWLIAELDAARGLAPAPVPPPQARSRWWRRIEEAPHPDDIPDPHELGPQWHPEAAARISQGVSSLLDVLRRLT